jgi:regulator of protease activity HflC (stomatin/prohibitin superfamily)
MPSIVPDGRPGFHPVSPGVRCCLVGRIIAGHLRSIIGALTVEEIIRERDLVARKVREGRHGEMEKLGIVVDALEIQEIVDKSGYIANVAAPHAAAVASQARIAAAQADQEACEREQQAAALKAQYERDTSIQRVGFEAETEQAHARAAQAGPLAEARASQEVIEQQTALAQRAAGLAAQRLEAYRRTNLADAEAQATRAQADGTAYARRVTAEADAQAHPKAGRRCCLRRQTAISSPAPGAAVAIPATGSAADRC